MSRWCKCEDFPCCGHASDGPLRVESGVEWYAEQSMAEREFTDDYMRPCPNCGEYRPKNDTTMMEEGICYLCTQTPERGDSPEAKLHRQHNGDTYMVSALVRGKAAAERAYFLESVLAENDIDVSEYEEYFDDYSF